MGFDTLGKFTAGTGTATLGAGGFSSLGVAAPRKKVDLSTIEGLRQTAEEAGFGTEAAKIADTTPKLSFLQRLGAGLSAFNPAQAVSVGLEKGLGAGLLEYPKSIGKGIASAFTGTDYQGERKYFANIAEEAGIENGIAKFGIGFVGDVLLDPTTYFGGAIARGIGIVGKGTASTVLKGVGRVAPDVESGLRLAGTGVQDALGRAFQFAYKSTEGAKEDVMSFLSKKQQAKLGLAASNLNRLGTGVLSKEQSEELALKMIAGKRAEFAAREAEQATEALPPTPLTQEATKYKSAEEFVKAQGETMFRSSASPFDVAKMGDDGIFISPDKPFVERWQKAQGYKNFEEFVISPEAKILKRENFPKRFVRDEGGLNFTSLDDQADIIKYAKENGFDGIEDYSIRAGQKIDHEFAVWNKDVIKTKSQLTDIWNKANKGMGVTPAEIAMETALKGTSPEVAKVIKAQSARSKQFAEGITDNPYETYFPFIKKDKLDKFLNESKGIKVGSEGYRKQFKNLLTNENLELDPAKAFFTSEAAQVSDRMTRDFLTDFVKRYGKGLDAFATSDEATKAGYALIKEKGIFGKELGYVSKYDGALIRDSLSPEFQTISMLAKATGFDAVTSLFKRAVTGLFLPFHVRNFVSGNIQNFEKLGVGVFNPKNMAIGQKIAYIMGKGEKIPAGTVELGGKTMKFSEVMKPFVNRFSGDTFYQADFDFSLKAGTELKSMAGLFSGTRIKETAKTLGLGQEAIPFKMGRAVGQFIEHQQKATAYITALAQGKSIDDALRLAESAGFDYRALTRFESQIMRRLVPFYSFTRKNIGLQLETLGENPQRINEVLRFFGNMGDTPDIDEKQSLPEYLAASIGIKIGDTPEGLKQYISSFGTPIEQFAGLLNQNPILYGLSQTNPLLKVPVEIGIGKDSFRQRDLKEVYDAREYKLAPQIIKDLLEIKEVQKDVLEKQPNGKLKKVGERTQYVADPVRLLIARSLFTSRGVSYLDQMFGGDIKGFAQFLKVTTGIKPQQIDIEVQKSIKDTKIRRALEDLLVKIGEARRFQNVYIPKQ